MDGFVDMVTCECDSYCIRSALVMPCQISRCTLVSSNSFPSIVNVSLLVMGIFSNSGQLPSMETSTGSAGGAPFF